MPSLMENPQRIHDPPSPTLHTYARVSVSLHRRSPATQPETHLQELAKRDVLRDLQRTDALRAENVFGGVTGLDQYAANARQMDGPAFGLNPGPLNSQLISPYATTPARLLYVAKLRSLEQQVRGHPISTPLSESVLTYRRHLLMTPEDGHRKDW